MSVSTRIAHGVTCAHTSTNSAISGGLTVSMAALTITFADGSGDDQANRVWRSTRSLAASANESIDLYDFGGTERDALGNLFTLAKVKALCIRNTSTTYTSTITIGNASNPFVGPFGAGTHTITLTPGDATAGVLLLVNGTGWTVTDTSAHLLKIANNDGTNAATYEIIVVGSQ